MTHFRRASLSRWLQSFVLSILLRFPKYRTQLDEFDQKFRDFAKDHLFKHRENPTHELPENGADPTCITEQMAAWATRDQKFQANNMSGANYALDDSTVTVSGEAMKAFVIADALHPTVFPGVRQAESEVVQITINLFNGSAEACGVLTTSGTESVLCAMLAYRKWGRARGIEQPEILAPITVHAAFEKAAHYFGMRLVHIPVTAEQVCDLRRLRREITRNTVVIVGSAPCFSAGTLDPLEEMGQLAVKYGVNFHVDACLGGFLIPFVEAAGFPLPPCDFRVTGVTSISCDPHKYGGTPKGVSVVMYSNPELRRLQYFVADKRCDGNYATPALTGSKPGNISVGAWAAILHTGRNGYIQSTKNILEAATFIAQQIQEIEGLELLGQPVMGVVAFHSQIINVHAVASEMRQLRGWSINSMQNPRSAHICLTKANCGLAAEFVEDLRIATETVKNCEDPNEYAMAALYSGTAKVPNTKVLWSLLSSYVDCLYAA